MSSVDYMFLMHYNASTLYERTYYMIELDVVRFGDDYVVRFKTQLNPRKYLINRRDLKPSFKPGWYHCEGEPKSVQEVDIITNDVFQIIDEGYVSERLKKILSQQEYDELGPNDQLFYDAVSEELERIVIDVEFNARLVAEYDSVGIRFDGTTIGIDGEKIEHDFAGSVLNPDIAQHKIPCRIPAQNLFTIIKTYIKDNIDQSKSLIVSDYVNSFTVGKCIKQTVTKVDVDIFCEPLDKTEIVHETTVNIFAMQPFASSNKYNHPVLRDLVADNEEELQAKLKKILDDIMSVINA